MTASSSGLGPRLPLVRGTGRPLLIGVVHLSPLPGAPRYAGSMPGILERAAHDARALSEGGADAVVVENFGDVPFFAERVRAETVAAMTLAVRVVQDSAQELPVGVNVLRNDARAALGICAATGAGFIRVNVHTGAAVTDQGLISSRAAETLRERGRIAPHVQILADVHVKHSSPLGSTSLVQAARDCSERGLADGLIVTGDATGQPPEIGVLRTVRDAVAVPVLIGSGLETDGAPSLFGHFDGAIVGTSLKRGGAVEELVDRARVRGLRELFEASGPA